MSLIRDSSLFCSFLFLNVEYEIVTLLISIKITSNNSWSSSWNSVLSSWTMPELSTFLAYFSLVSFIDSFIIRTYSLSFSRLESNFQNVLPRTLSVNLNVIVTAEWSVLYPGSMSVAMTSAARFSWIRKTSRRLCCRTGYERLQVNRLHRAFNSLQISTSESSFVMSITFFSAFWVINMFIVLWI